MNIAEAWKILCDGVGARNERLVSELHAAFGAMTGLSARQVETLGRIPQTRPNTSVQTLTTIFGPYCSELLLELGAEYRRVNPQQRVLHAFADYDRSVEDILRTMPETVTVSASEWREVIGSEGMSLLDRGRLWVQRGNKQIAFRQNLLRGFRSRVFDRRATEGRLLRAFAEMTLEMLTPWQTVLRFWFAALLGESSIEHGPAEETLAMRQRIDRHSRYAAVALSELDSWSRANPPKFANRFPMRTKPPKRIPNLEAHFRYQNFWVRQAHAVEAHLDIHTRLAAIEKDIMTQVQRVLDSVGEEHGALLKELDAVVSWLKTWQPGEESTFPAAQAEIAAITVRLSAWQQEVDRILRQMPESIEVSYRVIARPLLRPSWKALAARSMLQDSFDKEGLEVLNEGLGQLEQQHQSIIREIERAREVVAFAFESARSERSSEGQIEREGIDNALSLLRFHQEHVREVPPEVEQSFVAALSATLLRAHTVLSEGQWGLLRQTARYGIPATIRALVRAAGSQGRAGARYATKLSNRAFREALIRVGWISPPTTRMPHVIAREYLTHTPGSESQLEQLPLIYQRLFRLAPVEDSRFLIGRQEEMAALAEAHQWWKQGRDASALIVGERGSGKTSLINCALQSVITGAELVRGEFRQRLTQQHEMYDFLALLFGVSPESLESHLLSTRRVIVLEEIERTFLRRVGRYGAIRALINLISKTSRQNLWIVSTNSFAFRFLNAAVGLDAHFSHRINAMAVESPYLKEAVLMRHHLSGLRLQFAPRPKQGRYAERIRTMAGIESDSEDDFFDLLHRESGGVFRSAFALWHRYIERVGAGVLYLRYPAEPRFQSVLKALTDLDMLTLAAILQHGSLTPREISIIFRVDEATSNAWTDNLLARELIELDPGRDGFRIVPAAGEVVRQTLFQKNLG